MEKELYIHEDGERAVLLTNDRDMKLKDVTSLLQGDIPELKRPGQRTSLAEYLFIQEPQAVAYQFLGLKL